MKQFITLACCLCLLACIKPQATPNFITPDKDTVRKLRELADEAARSDQPKAAQLTAILFKARVQLWAIGNASNDEKAMIYAAEAAKTLGPCEGYRDDECDAAFVTQLERDLKVITSGKETESVQELKPLLDALKLISQKKPEGLSALQILTEEDSWRGTAARLFALSHLADTWSKAANGSTVQVLATLRAVSPLVCAKPLLECLPKTTLSPWAQEGAEAFAFGNTVLNLLQKSYSETSDFGKTAQTYALPALEKSFQEVLPLPPPASQTQIKTPGAQRWTNAALAFPQSVKSNELPRLYVSIQDHTLRLGLPPALQIIDKTLVLLGDAEGFTFPGKELDKKALETSIMAEIQALRSALTKKNPMLGAQLENIQAMVIVAEENTPIEEISLLCKALSSMKIASLSLLISPKQAPTKEELVFGAGIPLVCDRVMGDSIWLRSDNTYQTTIAGAPQELSTTDALLSEASRFTTAPQFLADPKVSIGRVVALYDNLRNANGLWGTLEQSPLLVTVY